MSTKAKHYREQTKTGFYREIPITDEIMSILPDRGIGKAPVFLNQAGRHCKVTRLSTVWQEAREGITTATFYQGTRHSKNN